MPIVYSYLRFSRPEQLRGDSLRRQVEKSEEWAKRHGHILDTSLDLRDLGISAFRGKNAQAGALGVFLECIETGRVKAGDYLALESLDRLSRQKISASLPLIQGILRAGVSIVTLSPERVYPPDTVDDLGALIEMLVVMSRAYEESATKSERLRAAWKNKRKRAGSEKLSKLAPAWLQLSNDRQRFEPFPERVEVVRRIFRMAGDGMGANAVAKRFNKEQVPVFGRAQHWQPSYIKKILRNRAVLGEYQPHRIQDGKRVPVGEPIGDYYPQIIDEGAFYAAARSTEERKGQTGRHGRRIANLFTGLLKDARDGSSLVVVDKGGARRRKKTKGPSLVSSAAKSGTPGAVYLSFPYQPFEQALLIWGYDLELGDVLPKKASNTEEQLHKAEGKVADLDHRVETVKAKIATAGNLDALLDTLVDLETKRTEAREKVERLKREQTTQAGEDLDQTQALIERLRGATEVQAYDLRIKLRSTLKRLIQDIVVLVIQVNSNRVALADIQLRNGKRRQVTIMPGGRVYLPEGLDSLDVREWANWPKSLKKTRFDVVSEEIRHMMALEDEGYTRAAIAEELGMSKSHVSRTLCSQGRKKQVRKAIDSDRLMTWHPQGRGWVKQHQGKRYFIGLGKLETLYPRLFEGKTEEGSWRAANRWWKEKLAESANTG